MFGMTKKGGDIERPAICWPKNFHGPYRYMIGPYKLPVLRIF